MTPRFWYCLAFTLLIWMPSCGGSVKERTYRLQPQPKAIEQVVQLLKRYRDGTPPGSELANLQGLTLDLRNQAPSQARVAEEAFEQLQETPQNAAAIAAEALNKLGIE